MMKKFIILSAMLLLVLFSLHMMVACGGDDGDDEIISGNITVTISETGEVSNGSIFVGIDDKNFYLDYVKYSVKEGHLIVSGYDKAGFNGTAKIVSSIKYKGNHYEVLGIGDAAFSRCTSLTSITIPNSVTIIEKSAFRDCSALTSITIPNSVTSIGGLAFEYCSGLTSITIPNSVTKIGLQAFNECSGLTSVKFGNGLTTIGSSAFSKCTSLTSITIPSSVTIIGESAFSSCSSLSSINVESDNKTYDSRDNCNAIIETVSNTLLTGCKNTIIPNSVKIIGHSAFLRCSLTSITIPSSVTTIEVNAFGSYSSLTSVTIPNSVTRIGEAAFQYCKALKAITIGSSVNNIETGAFRECSELVEIHCKVTTPPYINYYSFESNHYHYAKLYVPKESFDAYKQNDYWNNFHNIIEE